jgi:uncharacterized OB-fold protein
MSADRLLAPAPQWRGPVPADQLDYSPFWAQLRQHRLSIQRCGECRTWIHYPSAACPSCLGSTLAFEPVSGDGHVYTFTIVHREFGLHLPVPWVAAIVELVEQPGLRLASNIVNCTPKAISIGMPVRVVYVDYDPDLTLAYFEPAREQSPR